METPSTNPLVEFAYSLHKAVSELVGKEKVEKVYTDAFPNKEVISNIVDEIKISGDANLSHTLAILFENLLETLENNFGSDFTEAKINSLYRKFIEKNNDEKMIRELLSLIPKHYLENDRIRHLNKEELEMYILRKSKEIKDIKKSIEESIKNRTEKIEAVLREKEVSEKILKKNVETLKEENINLVESNKKKNEFVGVAAHQLRTPLSGIKWTLALIINGDFGELNEEQKNFITKTYDSTNRLIALVNDILGFEHMNKDSGEYVFESVSLSQLMDNLIFEMQTLANKKEIAVSFNPGTVEIPNLMLDKEKIRAVFQNLIENAIKYTNHSGKIAIEFLKREHDVQISISDNGIGIPEIEKQNIFKQFFRATNAISVQSEGTGLGLFIAKTIIERHGGTLSFESKEGFGTTFFIKLPLKNHE